MANTTIQLKKSGVSGNVPSLLDHGELAINFYDGKLYYKNAANVITYISSGIPTNSFATVNANSSLILASSNNDTLSFAAGNNITISACTSTKTITINAQDADVDQFARNTGNSALTLAQDAYNYANTISGGAAIDNVARTLAQSAFDKANLSITFAQSAYDQSNVSIGVDATQNTRLNSIETVNTNQNNSITQVNQFAQGAYNQANTNVSDISIINGINVTQNTRLNSIETINSEQNTAISIIQGVNLGQNVEITVIKGVDLTQNTRITEVNQYATSGYETANSAQANTIFTQVVDATQNVRLGSIETINNDQNTRMSIIESVDNTQNTRLNLIEIVNVDQNTAISIIQGTDVTQNVRLNSIETVNQDQNTSIAIIQGTDVTQNVRLNSIETINNDQNTTITQVNQFAQSAYDHANTKFASAGGTITGPVVISANNNLTVTGNLNVLGTTTTVNTNLLEVNDPMILLANGNFFSDIVDIGFSGSYNDGANAHTGLFREHTNKDWYLFQGYTPEVSGNNDININDASFRTANLNADYVKANVIATTAVIGGINFTNYVSLVQSIDATQNTRIGNIEGVNLTQNSAISIIQGVDLAQNAAITIIQGVDATQNTTITAVNQFAGAGFNTANQAFNQANTATGLAQAAFNYANTLTVSSTDQFARDTANSASANTIITQGVDSWQNTQITYVNQFAQAAFNQANTGGGGGGTTYNQSLNTTDPVIFSSVTFANNNSSMTGANTTPLTATPNQIVDTFSTTQYRTVKYIIQAVDEVAVHSTEVLLTHNDNDVFITEYATLQSASNLMSISANVSSSNVNLIISPTNSNTIIDYHRTTLQIARSLGFSIFGDLMLQTGNEDLLVGSGSWDENT